MSSPIRASDFAGNLSDFLGKYEYQPQLTSKLDGIEAVSLTPEHLNEIVLWKVNRYVSLDDNQIRQINALAELRMGQHRQARSILEKILAVHGVDLPMASTFFRFRNSSVFQIIDRHAYRALYGRDYRLYTRTPSTKKIEVYFTFIEDLRVLCQSKGLCFETIDRVLYVFDKKTNGSLSKGNSEG